MKRFRCKRLPDGGLILSAPALAYLKREMAARIARSACRRFDGSRLYSGDMLGVNYTVRLDVVRNAKGSNFVYIQFNAMSPAEVTELHKPRRRRGVAR